MSDPTDRIPTTRRTVLTAAAWSVPVIATAAAAPAMAASQLPQLGVVFDGGGGANGLLNSAYVNLYSPTGAPVTLKYPVTLTVNVVALSGSGTAERSFTAGSSNGTIARSSYNRTTRTTTITWTVPAGTVVPAEKNSTANPDILFSFGDGYASGGRITNKLVVTSISGGTLAAPSAPPIDSTVVKDLSGVSPDGIY